MQNRHQILLIKVVNQYLPAIIGIVGVDAEQGGAPFLGIAGQIIGACEEFLRSIGAVVMAALIEDINEPSINAFRKAGYFAMDEYKYFSKRRSWDD